MSEEELRDVFAGLAMQSYMRNCEDMKTPNGHMCVVDYASLAKYSYDIAEAMIAERNSRDV